MLLRNSQRNQVIDLLRGLSLLMVIAAHFGLLDPLVKPSGKVFWGRPVDDILAGMGFYGVAIFFVISGFLITGLSLRRYPALGQISLRGFWWMRFCRLAPMLVLCVLAILLFSHLGLEGFTFKSAENFHRTFTKLITFRFNELVGKGISPEPWSPLWSLSVEEMFYLGFPLLCWTLAGRSGLSWILVALIALSSCLKAGKFAGAYSTLGNMDLLSLGCLLALARPERLRDWSSPAVRLTVGLASAAVGLGLIGFCVLWAHPFRPYWAPEICGLGAGLILLSSQLIVLAKRTAALALPISTLGVISYEAYLVHQPLRQYLVLLDVDNVWLVVLLVAGLALALHLYFSEPLNLALRKVARAPEGPERSRGAAALAYPRPTPTWWLSHASVPIAAICLAAWAASPTYIPPFTVHFTSINTLPAGTSEPIAYIGQPGSGKLVFLQHEAAGSLILGIDDWNQVTQRSSPLVASDLTNADLRIDFSRAGVIVSRNEVPLVRTYAPPRRGSGQPRIGLNDIGFSSAREHAVSTFAVGR